MSGRGDLDALIGRLADDAAPVKPLRPPALRALAWLVAALRRAGARLLDCQFMTEHLRSFGAIEIPREVFRERLADAVGSEAVFQRDLDGEDACSLVQASTRTS